MNLDKEIIWIVREPRAGGTWFVSKLARFLNRKLKSYDQKDSIEMENLLVCRTQSEDDYKFVFDTHYFIACKGFKNYSNPVVLRVLRKNKVEQFLSFIIATKYNNFRAFNVRTEEERNKLPTIEKTIVPISDVYEFIKVCNKNENLWNQYAFSCRHETVYYEDLLNNYNSKVLPITNWSMKNNEDGLTLKLPYDKKEIFLNYNQIKEIINQELPNNEE